MENFTVTFNTITAAGTLIGQVFLLGVLVLWLSARFGGSRAALAALSWLGDRGVMMGFLVAFLATAGSLLYSNIIGFPPCELCWVQRIFLYPQVIILGLALWKKTKDAAVYSLALSGLGALVAAFHYYGQMFNPDALSACEAGGVSCAQLFFVEFGYITIPLMSLTTFIVIGICSYLSLRFARENN